MANDRNGTPIAIGTDYVVIGPAVKELVDGRVLLNVGKQLLVTTAAELSQVAALGGGGGPPGDLDFGLVTETTGLEVDWGGIT